MLGTTGQLVALAIKGNDYLTGRSTDAQPVIADSATKFCDSITFVDPIKHLLTGWAEHAFAADPTRWLIRLKAKGFKAIRLAHTPTGGTQVGGTKVPDRELAGFIGGGGQWCLEVIRDGVADLWTARWEVWNRNRPDRRIWHVTYGRIAQARPLVEAKRPSIEELRTRLAFTLKEIAAFAWQEQLNNFALVFERAQELLQSADPMSGWFYADMVSPGSLPLPAEQLLCAASTAWVFGGMGSWNDVSFEGESQKSYDTLSTALFELLNSGIMAATNASARVG